MASALLPAPAAAALRRACLRRSYGRSPAPDYSQDKASIKLQGTVERVLATRPSFCSFTVQTRVLLPESMRPCVLTHFVRVHDNEADTANAAVRVGARVHVEGLLMFERRNPGGPPGKAASYRSFVRASSVKAED